MRDVEKDELDIRTNERIEGFLVTVLYTTERRADMNLIFDEIKNCKGYDNCWGVIAGPSPIALRASGKVDIMVITEQRPPEKEKRESLEDELARVAKEYREGIHPSSAVINSINNLFCGEFLHDFDAENKCFNRFYWTHFIKCPGNLRERAKKSNWTACAKHWLDERKEIDTMDPKLIVCFGANASKWVLRQAGINEDWFDWIWKNEVIQFARKEGRIPVLKISGKERKLLLLFHPSRRNPLGRKINEKIVTVLQQLEELNSMLRRT